MTVQEMIDALMKIEDKSKYVLVDDDGSEVYAYSIKEQSNGVRIWS